MNKVRPLNPLVIFIHPYSYFLFAEEEGSETEGENRSQVTDEDYVSDAASSFRSMSLTPVHHFDMRLDILKNSLEVYD